MPIQYWCLDELAPMAWKNGGGSTREILSWPPSAGLEDFEWRASIATIAASGPFSVFAGVDRTIMLLEGSGVHLKGGDIDHLLDAPLRPFAFNGDIALDGVLQDGESIDFNVMCRRARCHAEVQVVEDRPLSLARSRSGLLMSVEGDWRAGDLTLSQGQGIWWADHPCEWDLAPARSGARLVAVRMHDRPDA